MGDRPSTAGSPGTITSGGAGGYNGGDGGKGGKGVYPYGDATLSPIVGGSGGLEDFPIQISFPTVSVVVEAVVAQYS